MSDQNPANSDPSNAIPGFASPPGPLTFPPPVYESADFSQPPTSPDGTEPTFIASTTPTSSSYPAPPVTAPYPATPPAPGPWDPTPGAYPPPPAPGTPYGYPVVHGPGGTTLVEWPTRALGALVDYVAPTVIIFVIAMVLSRSVHPLVGSLVQYGFLAAWWAYLGYLSGTHGITPGRAIAKTKLVSAETGQVIGVGAGIARQAAHLLDTVILYLGWLFPLWDAQKQTLADKIVKTMVIDNSADPSAGQIRWS